MEKDNELMPWQKKLIGVIMGTSFTDMPLPTYEVIEYGGVYQVLKVYWNGTQFVLSEHHNKEEAEAMRKLAEFSE